MIEQRNGAIRLIVITCTDRHSHPILYCQQHMMANNMEKKTVVARMHAPEKDIGFLCDTMRGKTSPFRTLEGEALTLRSEA